MKIPIDPLPESELCPYEKLRENNIKERLEAMRKCGFFEDLDSYKKDIGLGRVSKTSRGGGPHIFWGGYRPFSPFLGGVQTSFNIFKGGIDGFMIF